MVCCGVVCSLTIILIYSLFLPLVSPLLPLSSPPPPPSHPPSPTLSSLPPTSTPTPPPSSFLSTGVFRAVQRRVNPRIRSVKGVYKTYIDAIHFRLASSEDSVRTAEGYVHYTIDINFFFSILPFLLFLYFTISLLFKIIFQFCFTFYFSFFHFNLMSYRLKLFIYLQATNLTAL